MSVLKIRDANGKFVSIPAIVEEVNESSIRAAIPSLIKVVKSQKLDFVTLAGESIPVGQTATGSYIGAGYGTNTQVSLAFDFEPQLILIKAPNDKNNYLAMMIRGDGRLILFRASISSPIGIDWHPNGVTFIPLAESVCPMNTEGVTYTYIAIGSGGAF